MAIALVNVLLVFDYAANRLSTKKGGSELSARRPVCIRTAVVAPNVSGTLSRGGEAFNAIEMETPMISIVRTGLVVLLVVTGA